MCERSLLDSHARVIELAMLSNSKWNENQQSAQKMRKISTMSMRKAFSAHFSAYHSFRREIALILGSASFVVVAVVVVCVAFKSFWNRKVKLG